MLNRHSNRKSAKTQRYREETQKRAMPSREQSMKGEIIVASVVTLVLMCAGAVAQNNAPVTPEQIKAGAEIYATNCATCHGNRMKNPEWAIDLATIPKDDRQRFIQSVSGGRQSCSSSSTRRTSSESMDPRAASSCCATDPNGRSSARR